MVAYVRAKGIGGVRHRVGFGSDRPCHGRIQPVVIENSPRELRLRPPSRVDQGGVNQPGTSVSLRGRRTPGTMTGDDRHRPQRFHHPASRAVGLRPLRSPHRAEHPALPSRDAGVPDGQGAVRGPPAARGRAHRTAGGRPSCRAGRRRRRARQARRLGKSAGGPRHRPCDRGRGLLPEAIHLPAHAGGGGRRGGAVRLRRGPRASRRPSGRGPARHRHPASRPSRPGRRGRAGSGQVASGARRADKPVRRARRQRPGLHGIAPADHRSARRRGGGLPCVQGPAHPVPGAVHPGSDHAGRADRAADPGAGRGRKGGALASGSRPAGGRRRLAGGGRERGAGGVRAVGRPLVRARRVVHQEGRARVAGQAPAQ